MIQYLSVDIYLVVNLRFLIIILLIWCYFDKLGKYFWIFYYCLCIETIVEAILAEMIYHGFGTGN